MKDLVDIIFKESECVAQIIFNRPEKLNSVIRPMAISLQMALDYCEEKSHIRSILLTGAGKAFCAGQDLNEVIQNQDINISTIVSEHFNPIIARIRKIEKPVISAVNGVAAGAGANIALAADICIAKNSASFIQAFSKIGLIPDSGGTFILPRLIGMQRATAITMLGEKISAEYAAEIGMIYKAVPDENFWSYCLNISKKLAGMPTRALGLTKRALNKSLTNDLHSQLVLEDQLQTEAANTEDYQEGVSAFLEKRKAMFKGF